MAPSDGKPRVDNTYAWALASVPVISLAVAAPVTLMGFDDAWTIAILVGLVLNVLFAMRDEDRLAEAGVRGWGVVWAVLLVPVYLVGRAGRVSGSVFIPIAWVLATAVYMVGLMVVEERAPVDIDDVWLESAIDDWLDDNGIGGVTDCPEASVRVDDTFTCEVSGGPASLVEVTVEDIDGAVTWQVVG
jgi:hypothetical protein